MCTTNYKKRAALRPRGLLVHGALAREDQEMEASPASGAFSTPLSPRALQAGRESQVWLLRAELQAERAEKEEQRKHMQAQLESVMAADDGTPTVLMLHIPLCLPETLKLVPGAGSLFAGQVAQ